MKNIVIIDYQMSNLYSVKHALEAIGAYPTITSDPKKIECADAAILPGVGAFGDAMKHLKDLNMIIPIKKFILTGKPFMGICLGMQLLMDKSEEFGMHKGLGIIEGEVKKIPKYNSKGKQIKIPHIGWNRLRQNKKKWSYTPFRKLNDGEYMYFVHSYVAIPKHNDMIISATDHSGFTFCSSILYKNIFAVQFHPEKSGIKGLEIYNNFF